MERTGNVSQCGRRSDINMSPCTGTACQRVVAVKDAQFGFLPNSHQRATTKKYTMPRKTDPTIDTNEKPQQEGRKWWV